MTAVAYWDRGVEHVPVMTGAASVMDGRDILSVCDELEITCPIPDVLDVGCGTGRMAAHCDGYLGVDIAPSAVEYCQRRGLSAHVIAGPDDVPRDRRHWVLCLSVFTHIDRDARRAYLARFAAIASNLLVDIIPGDGRGTVALWTAVADTFLRDVVDTGFTVVDAAERVSPDGVTHLYYRCRGSD